MTKYHTCHSGLEPRVVVAGDLVLVVVVPGVVEVVVDGGAAHQGSVESDGVGGGRGVVGPRTLVGIWRARAESGDQSGAVIAI